MTYSRAGGYLTRKTNSTVAIFARCVAVAPSNASGVLLRLGALSAAASQARLVHSLNFDMN